MGLFSKLIGRSVAKTTPVAKFRPVLSWDPMQGIKTGTVYRSTSKTSRATETVRSIPVSEVPDPGRVTRPIASKPPNQFNAMAHGGQAEGMRRKLTDFGSAARGVIKLSTFTFERLGLKGAIANTFAPNLTGKLISSELKGITGLAGRLGKNLTKDLRDVVARDIRQLRAAERTNKPFFAVRDDLSEFLESRGWNKREARLYLRSTIKHERTHQLILSMPQSTAEWHAYQQGYKELPGFHLFNLTEDLTNRTTGTFHPKGSTVTAKTLLESGFRPKIPLDQQLAGLPEEVTSRLIKKGYSLNTFVEETVALAHQTQYLSKFSDPRTILKQKNLPVEFLLKYAEKSPVGRVPRPQSNKAVNAFDGMSHGTLASKLRKRNTDFGSWWSGLKKLGVGEVLEKIGSKYGRIWKQSEKEFVGTMRRGTLGEVEYFERSEEFVSGILQQVTQAAKAQKLGPGLQAFGAKLGGNAADESFIIAYLNAFGEATGAGVLGRTPSGEIIRKALVVSQPYRGKGLSSAISQEMFLYGGVATETLSTAGAKAYYRQVSKLANSIEEAELVGVSNLINAQTRNTIPGLHSSIGQTRGSRQGPFGGAG